jgi:hypothetical protein
MFNPQTLSAQQSVHTTASLEMSSLANISWSILTDYRVVRSVDLLGLLLATLLVCLWCLQTYKSFKKEGLRPKASEIILSIVLIGLLSNNAMYLKELTFAAKNTVNSIKAPLNKVVEEGSKSSIVPVNSAEQNRQSSGRSNIPVDNSNLSTVDAMRNAHIKESIIRYQNYFLIE